MKLTNEQERKLYNEYLAGVKRESKKGAVQEPKTFAQWASTFEYRMNKLNPGESYLSNTKLREINKTVINSSKNTLTRKQNRILESRLLEDSWMEKMNEEKEYLEERLKNANSVEQRSDIIKRMRDLEEERSLIQDELLNTPNLDRLITAKEGETKEEKEKRLRELRKWTAFEGKAFTERLESLGLQSWYMFFNS